MLWGGRWEGGSCLGTHVRIKDFKIKKKKKKKRMVKMVNFMIRIFNHSLKNKIQKKEKKMI